MTSYRQTRHQGRYNYDVIRAAKWLMRTQTLMHAIPHGGCMNSLPTKWAWEKQSLAATGIRTRVSIAPGFSVGRCANWAFGDLFSWFQDFTGSEEWHSIMYSACVMEWNKLNISQETFVLAFVLEYDRCEVASLTVVVMSCICWTFFACLFVSCFILFLYFVWLVFGCCCFIVYLM